MNTTHTYYFSSGIIALSVLFIKSVLGGAWSSPNVVTLRNKLVHLYRDMRLFSTGLRPGADIRKAERAR